MVTKLQKIYALIICLVMTFTLFFVSVKAYDIATDLLLPKYKYSDKMQAYSSNKEFLESLSNKEKKLFSEISDVEISKERNKRKENEFANIKRQAIVKSINLSGLLLITVIFLWIHWGLYKRSFYLPE